MIYYVNPVEITGQVASASSDIVGGFSSLLSDMFVYISSNPILCALFVLLILLLILVKLLEFFKNPILKEFSDNDLSITKKEENKLKSNQEKVNIKKRIKAIKNKYRGGIK